MQFLFYNTKEEFKADQLFEENEIIKIRQNSFEQILEKLETYNLSDTQDDVKGIAFEQFLGTTFRGELGQYFTPRTIVDFMTHILDPKENETVCDPTCGSGGFLIKAFEYMREKIEEDVKKAKSELRSVIEGENYDSLSEKEQVVINERIEAMQSTLNKELDTQVEGSRMYNLSRNCIYGTDANPRMARTSKMNMIMHGDGHGGVHHHDGLLNVNGIFEERFDVILTNPPFGARIDKSQKITEADKFTDEALIAKYKEKYGEAYEKALKQVNDNIGKSLLSLYDVGSMSGLTEVLFMERCLRLLKKGGRMGMVLPEGVLNTSNLQKIREYFEGKAKIILICSIPQDVFIAAGATVKPSLVFFKRFTEEEELQYLGAKTRAEKEIRQKYIGQIKALQEKIVEEKSKKLKVKALIAAAEKELRDLEKAIIEEAKPLTKEYFHYEIPIAMVEDAGITSTGAVSAGNQLPTLQDEYKEYRIAKKLWNEANSVVSYTINSQGSRKIKCDYKLQYTLNEINCVIEQTNGFLRCYGPKFKRREYFIEENAPHNIIGLYSGEEDRLWTSFYETYYKSYIKRIKTNRHQERMRLMLINKYYWNVALLTLLLSGNETLKPFIENDLGITSISTIELKFNFKYFDDVKVQFTRDYTE